MGLPIDQDRFVDEDYRCFSDRLKASLHALEILLRNPDFGNGSASLGAELEVSLVGTNSRPLPLNIEVLRETNDPRMTVELNRFNMESNLRHTPLAGRPFEAMRREIEGAITELSRAAAVHQGRIAMVGILPTLVAGDLQSNSMTDAARFRALSWALQRARLEPFQVRIDGEDPLEITCDDIAFEGAATSFQVHLRVNPKEYNSLYNAVQLATAPVLAVSGNSPTFIGHRLWEETRVALFKQAVDDRDVLGKILHREPRVSFGTHWIQGGVLELFRDAVANFPPLLPAVSDEDPTACMRAGRIPRLEEIRLHQGTVWHWNRPIYDPGDGGHLRIEMRALPSGPTTADLVANAAFLVGLTLALAPRADDWLKSIPFEDAHNNFYRAAQSGLKAELIWPGEDGAPCQKITAKELIPQLIPLARQGLVDSGVDSEEAEQCLSIIAKRCANGQTGAVWQRNALAAMEANSDRSSALCEMLERYLEFSAEGLPVHRWPQAK
jgi:gamma-glutamyl:cysteine ligase YbdK (ATP-grasp superfamily)